jgi:hypothetical protein
MGYEVEKAKDGLAAIDLYMKAGESQRPYQVVILDPTVPGGGTLPERLLAIDPGVKGVILNGYTDDPVIAELSGGTSLLVCGAGLAEISAIRLWGSAYEAIYI